MVRHILTIALAVAAFAHASQAMAFREVQRRSCAESLTCLNEVPMLVDMVEKDFAGSLLPLTYEPLLDFACSKRRNITRCLTDVYCTDKEHKYTGGAVVEILNYICSTGRTDLLEQRACLSRDDFEEGIVLCGDILRIESDLTLTQKLAWMGDSTCSTIESFYECVARSTSRVCSEDAAELVEHIYRHVLMEMEQDSECGEPNDDHF